MEEFSDAVHRASSHDINANTFEPLPTDWALSLHTGATLLRLAVSKEDANSYRNAFDLSGISDSIFKLPWAVFTAVRWFCRFHSPHRELEYGDWPTASSCTQASFFYGTDDEASFAYCRVNAYTSRALMQCDFASIRAVRCISGLIEKAIRKEPNGPHNAQLVSPGWGGRFRVVAFPIAFYSLIGPLAHSIPLFRLGDGAHLPTGSLYPPTDSPTEAFALAPLGSAAYHACTPATSPTKLPVTTSALR